MTEALDVPAWGSDVAAAVLRALDFDYVALNPGASYRGLHDSIVNYLGNEKPHMLMCLHEEHAVAIAHGYAKVTGRPMLAIVHSNVGLMHASMAIFNAWCDRVPMLILGANGPVDAAQRRPWIDWIHSTQDTSAIARNYTKWDDQPGSVEAAAESLLRANQYARTAPYGPTFVVLDVAIQEQELQKPVALPTVRRFEPPAPAKPGPADVTRILEILRAAKAPVIFAGRVGRSLTSWNERIRLAEAFGARVITDMKVGAAFPSRHPLSVSYPDTYLTPDAVAIAKAADVLLNLDFIDFGGALKQIWRAENPPPTIISSSPDRALHTGWVMDHGSLPPIDVDLAVDPDILVSALARELPSPTSSPPQLSPALQRNVVQHDPTAAVRIGDVAMALADALSGIDASYIRLPIGLSGEGFHFSHPLDYLGSDGGGGLGSGCGMAVGGALGLRGTGRLAVAMIGDGDFLMGESAIWTAVANDIPLLIVVGNNRSYFNDEVHQERVARRRGRSVERKWIGMRIDGPPPDLANLARSYGAIGIGPLEGHVALRAGLAEAVAHLQAGNVCIVDAIVLPPTPGK